MSRQVGRFTIFFVGKDQEARDNSTDTRSFKLGYLLRGLHAKAGDPGVSANLALHFRRGGTQNEFAYPNSRLIHSIVSIPEAWSHSLAHVRPGPLWICALFHVVDIQPSRRRITLRGRAHPHREDGCRGSRSQPGSRWVRPRHPPSSGNCPTIENVCLHGDLGGSQVHSGSAKLGVFGSGTRVGAVGS